MSQPRKRRFGVLFVLSALIAGGAAYWLVARYLSFADAPIVGIEAGESLVVDRGDSFADVLGKLHALGVRDGQEVEWQLLARQLRAAGRLQVGEYALAPGITPRALLQRMRDGKVVAHRFTIIEGWNMRNLRAALARATPLENSIGKLDDRALMSAIGAAGQQPEGRFLPETYSYTRGESDLDVLKRAHQAMDRALDAAWAARAPDLVLKNKEEALILASIVEKETGVAAERAQVAGVFLRRLAIGMRLQTDASVIYGMQTLYAGNISRKDLQADTPYNTYQHAGLPPTPIAMPGVDALKAATQPAPGDALYFVAVGDHSGRHVFSRTLEEHQNAVREFLRRYRQRVTPSPVTPAPVTPAPPREQ